MSLHLRTFCASVACILVCSPIAWAQGFKPIVSTNLGFIENRQDDPGQPHFALYPEVEVSTGIARSKKALLSLSGAVYMGGWRDGVDELSHCADCITYSYSSIILGTRIGVRPDAFPLPLSIWGGFSRHWLSAQYVGGAGVAGNIESDYQDAFNALETGVRLQVPVSGHFLVGGDVQAYLALPVSASNPYTIQRMYGLVVTYLPK